MSQTSEWAPAAIFVNCVHVRVEGTLARLVFAEGPNGAKMEDCVPRFAIVVGIDMLGEIKQLLDTVLADWEKKRWEAEGGKAS